MPKPFVICGLALLLFLASAYCIIWPEHNCKYFTYGVENGKNYVGLFTAPKAGVQRINWNVTFVLPDFQQNPIASVEHYPSRMKAVENIKAGKYTQLIARFRNFDEVLPKLVDLKVNEETLCSNPGWGQTVTIIRVITAT